MYKQTTYLPIISQVNEGVIHEIPHFFKRNNIHFNRILIVSGGRSSCQYAAHILATMDAEHLTVNKEKDSNAVEDILDKCRTSNVDLIIGVGGGFILDAVKRASFLADIENLLVPSIISNDGLISPIAVIPDHSGRTHSLPGKMPLGIVVDLDIVRKAPIKFLQSAAGDILSNMSATNDWVLANTYANEPINDVAYMLSRSAAYSLLHHDSKDINNRNFIKQIIYCQINSGLAMALAGTSRPCSGSEHLISHAIDFKNLSEHTLHGMQVGSISIFCLYLQKKLDAKCLNYAFELHIPYAFDTLNAKIYKELKEIYETALVMRPGRFTVLNLFKEQPFDDLYNEFITFLNRFKSST